jgi:hypothetical protein
MRSYLPSNAQNPFGMLKAVLTSKDAAACSALAQSGLRVVLSPIDLALSGLEQSRYCYAGAPQSGKLPGVCHHRA